jgi:hypothetical protein
MSNGYMLARPRLFGHRAYDWWWHHFTGHDEEGAEHGFFLEVFVINATLDTPQPQRFPKPPCYAMIKAGTWPTKTRRGKQLNRFFSVRELTADRKRLGVRLGPEIQITETRLVGTIECTEPPSRANLFSDRGKMRWSLWVDKPNSFHPGYATGSLSRELNLFDMFWYVRGMNARFRGWVEIDGRRYRVHRTTSCGYQDKNWGRTFTSPWLWVSGSRVRSSMGVGLPGACFVLGGTCPTVAGVPVFGGDRILLRVVIPGRPAYEFNFTRPGYGGATTWRVHRDTRNDIMRWDVRCERPGLRVHVQIGCPTQELMNIRYEDPWGKIEFPRLWNGGTGSGTLSINDEVFYVERCGCEYGRRPASSR